MNRSEKTCAKTLLKRSKKKVTGYTPGHTKRLQTNKWSPGSLYLAISQSKTRVNHKLYITNRYPLWEFIGFLGTSSMFINEFLMRQYLIHHLYPLMDRWGDGLDPFNCDSFLGQKQCFFQHSSIIPLPLFLLQNSQETCSGCKAQILIE